MVKTKTPDTKKTATAMAAAALGKLAADLLLLDVREITSLADYFIICSGNSERQVKAIVDAIDEEMGKAGVNPMHVEGLSECRWVLMDYGDVVVHVFDSETRGYYDLDGLWGDAPKVEV